MLRLLIVVLATASCALAMPQDPRTTKFNNVIYDTTAEVEKIRQALTQHKENLMGAVIRFRANDGCLDGNFDVPNKSPKEYAPTANTGCDKEHYTATQRWVLSSDRLLAGNRSSYPGMTISGVPCLNWSKTFSILRVADCLLQNDDYNLFTVSIHDDQIDFDKLRLFFSIHSKAVPSWCLTYDLDPLIGHEVFTLKDCTGNKDKQSFYLPNVDFEPDVKDIYNHVHM